MERKTNNTTISSLNNINYRNDLKIYAFVFYFMNEKSRAISFAKQQYEFEYIRDM